MAVGGLLMSVRVRGLLRPLCVETSGGGVVLVTKRHTVCAAVDGGARSQLSSSQPGRGEQGENAAESVRN